MERKKILQVKNLKQYFGTKNEPVKKTENKTEKKENK